MFLTTENQERVLGVLEKTRFLRIDQVMLLVNDSSDGHYARRIVRQLRYMQRVHMVTEDIIALPFAADRAVDEPMLAAVDIALDIAGKGLLAVSSCAPPAKLGFITETKDGIGSYVVVHVPLGHEAVVNPLLSDEMRLKRTPILLLEDVCQQERFYLPFPHFFAVFDGQYRYFKGGSSL